MENVNKTSFKIVKNNLMGFAQSVWKGLGKLMMEVSVGNVTLISAKSVNMLIALSAKSAFRAMKEIHANQFAQSSAQLTAFPQMCVRSVKKATVRKTVPKLLAS